MKYIIIGGVAGGATAAARLRRIDEQSEIILLDKGSHISYANCGLPYYLGGVIPERDNLFVQNPHSFGERFNVKVRVEEEAIDIDTSAKVVTIKNRQGETYEETYDKLLLAPGAIPVLPPIPGVDNPGVFTLRTIADADALHQFIQDKKPSHATIVGGGLIGLEVAENLTLLGIKVLLVEREAQVLPMYDEEIVAPIHAKLKKQGIELRLCTSVVNISQETNDLVVQCEKGEAVHTNLVLFAVGIKPQSSLAKKAKLALGARGGIRVNSFLQTSAEDVYAVGDAIEYPHPLTGEPWHCFLAGPANRQARIAADNMAVGNKITYEGSIGTSIAKVFDTNIALTGLSEKQLVKQGIPYLTSTSHSASHAGYYPGSSMITTKLLFSPDEGKLLGAQCIGKEGVDKRIDQFALAIKLGASVEDLTKVEQAYAPPFSAAKDPVAIAGYVASNVQKGFMPNVTADKLHEIQKEGGIVVDVRSEKEFSHGAIPGAINIPLETLRDRVGELPKDRPIIVHCAIGMRGYLALRILEGNGYRNVFNLAGGYRTYSAFPHPTEK